MKWFHPKCIGIEELDEVKLNQMDIICLSCSGQPSGENQHKSELDEEGNLGKRSSPRPLEERDLNCMETAKQDLEVKEMDQLREKLPESEDELEPNIAIFKEADSMNSNDSKDLSPEGSERMLEEKLECDGMKHSLPNGAVETQSDQVSSNEQPTKNHLISEIPEVTTLKKTPKSKREGKHSELSQKASLKSSLGHTPTKQSNILNYFSVVGQSPSKQSPNPPTAQENGFGHS